VNRNDISQMLLAVVNSKSMPFHCKDRLEKELLCILHECDEAERQNKGDSIIIPIMPTLKVLLEKGE